MMTNVPYTFEQLSSSFGVEEMKQELKANDPYRHGNSFYDDTMFRLESKDLNLQLFLGFEDFDFEPDEDTHLQVLMDVMDAKTCEIVDRVNVSGELDQEWIQLDDVESFMVEALKHWGHQSF